MNVKKKILPVICLMSAYVHWIKPRLMSISATRGGKSLLLHLCGRSRFLIPMIVFTAFWLFDAQMQIEASISMQLRRNVHITIGAVDQDIQVEDEEDDDDNSDDDDDDNDNDNDDEDVEELYTIESCSEVSSVSHDSIPDLDDLNVALQEFFDSNGTRGMFAIRNDHIHEQLNQH